MPECSRCHGTGTEPWKPKSNYTKSSGWACPKCHEKHYDVYANKCPSCGLDFNSSEFNDIVRNLK